MSASRPRAGLSGWTAIAILAAVEIAAIGASVVALVRPAAAQLDERFPFLENRRRLQQQQQQQNQWGSPFGHEQPRQAPVESTRPPAPRRADAPPSLSVVVFGDQQAEWLAYGLEDAFAETPEVGISRKVRASTGLIRVEQRGESYDWPAAARDILNSEKPDFVVMMLGLSDRRGIREAIRQQPARPPAGQKQDQAKQPAQPAAAAQGQAGQQAPATPAPEAQKQTDPEAPPPDPNAAAANPDPSAAPPEGAIAGTVVHEFKSEKWGELYSRRIDEMIGVLKAKGIPVLWVGLPAIRGSRGTSDVVYLNDLYRGRAEKAGIVYIDVWDGFVDDNGNYSNYGPDFEGQTRRLRHSDGVHFTKFGARKLGHYVEREIRRLMLARTTPLATPSVQEPDPEDTKAPAAAAAPGLPPRPIASPIMSLTAPRGAGDTLLGGPQARSTASDAVIQRVLVKGEAIEAPAGRADDFTWPRRDIVTATGVLPPDPVEPPPQRPSDPAVAATPAPQKQAAPRPPRPQQQQQQQTGWQPWGQQQSSWGWGQRRDDPRQQQRQQGGGGFFGGLFGGSRW
jgi:hypothetical protein